MTRKQDERRGESLRRLLELIRILRSKRMPMTVAEIHTEYSDSVDQVCERSIRRDLRILIDHEIIVDSLDESCSSKLGYKLNPNGPFGTGKTLTKEPKNAVVQEG